jgi:hypothetical protein
MILRFKSLKDNLTFLLKVFIIKRIFAHQKHFCFFFLVDENVVQMSDR